MVSAKDKRMYYSVVLRLVNYLDNTEYGHEHIVQQARMNALRPQQIVQWMKFRAYDGNIDADDEAPVTGCRSNSLYSWKKSISYFHPLKNMTWNDMASAGNPTKSIAVNDFIKHVVKLETRKRGRPSRACRPLEIIEYQNLIKGFLSRWQTVPASVTFGFTAYCNFQLSMIARVDDTAQWKKEHFKAHPQFPEWALKTKLNWCKNVRTEVDCPWQSLLGAMNPLFCVLLHLAAFLEFHHRNNVNDHSPYVFSFNTDHGMPHGGNKTKATMSKALRDILALILEVDPQAIDFDDSDGKCGTHSIRKTGGGHVRRCGCSKDDKDYRGRWRDSSRQSDVYDYRELPYVDMSVCAKLCIGGACSYVTMESVTAEFVTTQVTPNITRVFGQQMGLVLGRALMWGVFDADWSLNYEDAWVARVKEQFDLIPNNGLAQGQNPVEKKLLIVSGHEGQVILTQIENGAEADANMQVMGGAVAQQGVVGQGGGFSDAQGQALIAQGMSLQHEVVDMKQTMETHHAQNMLQHRTHTTNLRRLQQRLPRYGAGPVNNPQGGGAGAGGIAVVVPVDNGEAAAAAVVVPAANATLSPTPRTLYDLWQEWQFGRGGRKPAKDFTPAERGRERHKYCRRRVVWKIQQILILKGLTAQAASDRLYAVYGEGATVTTIINRLKQDKRNNTLHPDFIQTI